MMEYHGEQWDIGTYCGEETVCVNLRYNGINYHRHDYGGFLPKKLRIGRYIRQVRKEAGVGNGRRE